MTAKSKSLRQLLGLVWKQRSIPTGVGLTLCAGVFLSVATTILVWNWEQDLQVQQQTQQNDRLGNALQHQIDTALNSLWVLGKYYAELDNIQGQSFRQLARPKLNRYRSLQAIAWVPRTVDPQTRAIPGGPENFSPPSIEVGNRTLGANGNLNPSGREYFSPVYIEPVAQEHLATGLDFPTLARQREALEQARDRDQVVLTEAIAANLNPRSLVAFMPVYNNSNQGDRIEAAEGDRLTGFVLGFLSLPNLIQLSLAEVQLTQMNVCIWDETGRNTAELIAFYPAPGGQVNGSRGIFPSISPSQPAAERVCPPPEELQSNPRRSLNVGGRQWTVRAVPTAEYQRVYWHWRWGTVLFAGLLWTLIPIVILVIYLGRMAGMQKLVPKLSQANDELSKSYSEITLLNHTSDLLQACLTVEEAYTVISTLVKPLFPEHSGGIFTLASANNLVETVCNWGDFLHSELVFSADECLALRRGQPYWVKDSCSSLLCQHLHPDNPPGEYVCIPLVAHGEILGVLYLSSVTSGQLSEAKYRLAAMVARQIAMALANLKLRATLKNESIRDPLTNLFNRRYMEESLDREIRRARRLNSSIGIIMIDVDYFKKVNDSYGHEAGDLVLKELAEFLEQFIRNSDIVCRYGGEEFTLILPEAPLEVTYQRAQSLREAIKELKVLYRQQPIGPITLSMGVASFPEHGQTAVGVIQSADVALYQSKAEGRDRVTIALL